MNECDPPTSAQSLGTLHDKVAATHLLVRGKSPDRFGYPKK